MDDSLSPKDHPVSLTCLLSEVLGTYGRLLCSKQSGPGWETDLYTPPVLGNAALFDNSAPAIYKNLVP